MNSLLQFLVILRARALIAMAIFVAVMVVVIAITLMTEKKYVATTSVVIDYRESDPFSQQTSAAQMAPSYMATQIDIIGSHKVALKAVRRLGLANNAAIRKNFQEANDGKGNIEDWLAGVLLRDVSVKPGRESRVVHIGFTAVDPRFAAVVADAFAQAYIDTNLELSVEPARRNAEWFDVQLGTLRIKMEEAQNTLTRYQQEMRITATDERLDTETKQLEVLATQLSAAQADTMDVKSRQLGERHPQYERAIDRERELSRAYERQKQRVLDFKRQRDQIGFYIREAETAQRIYEAALQRYNTSTLESHVNQTNITVLSAAVVPLTPSSPKAGRNVAMGALLGSMLGVGVAFLIEFLRRRVRTRNDIADVLEVPVIGTLARGVA